jgi:hypothetical protein
MFKVNEGRVGTEEGGAAGIPMQRKKIKEIVRGKYLVIRGISNIR